MHVVWAVVIEGTYVALACVYCMHVHTYVYMYY